MLQDFLFRFNNEQNNNIGKYVLARQYQSNFDLVGNAMVIMFYKSMDCYNILNACKFH